MLDSGLRRKDEKEKYDKLSHSLAILLLLESTANAFVAKHLKGKSPFFYLQRMQRMSL